MPNALKQIAAIGIATGFILASAAYTADANNAINPGECHFARQKS